MPLISKVAKGQAVTAEKMNSIIDALNEARLTSVVGGQFSRGLGGTTITVTSPRSQPNVVATVCPFEPTATAVTSGFNVSFSAGTINGILPTNMFSPITGVTTAGRSYFYIKCATDGKLLTTAVIEKDTSVRTPQASNSDTAPNELNVLIGYMTTDGIAVKTIPCSNIVARVFPTIQEDNVTYVAGERNFKQYYNWGF